MLGRGGAWVTSIASAGAGAKYVRTTRFVSIGSLTSGTVTLPSSSQVVLDDFGGTVDAVVLQISGGKPTQRAALTATGSVVATTFDASGNWVFSGTPVAYPVAIVYRVKQTLADFDSTSSDIWGDTELATAQTGALNLVIDGGGSVITTGLHGDLIIPYDCTIVGSYLSADQSGSIVIDIWKKAFASFPPLIANTIVASAPPTLSSAASASDVTLTGWTVACLAGDVLRYNVNSATTVTRILLSLKVVK